VAVEFGIITSVVPPGSWHYPQVLASGDTVRITGFSFEQLLASMLDFRMRHLELVGGAANASIEAVRRDLKAYLCAHFPQNCADSKSSPGKVLGIGITNYQTPIDRSANWLSKVGNTRLEFVDPALASNRAQICAGCQQNVRWATPCAPCNDNVLVRIQNAKGNLRTPYDKNLFMCRVYGHVNEVAVWLKDTHSVPEHTPPAICWQLQERTQSDG
jgi:hypothetical protein